MDFQTSGTPRATGHGPRRAWLRQLAGLVGTAVVGGSGCRDGAGMRWSGRSKRTVAGAAGVLPALAAADEAFLEELERAAFRFFWENADARTGQIKDRSKADGPDARPIASIASTGFGLTALCVADARGWEPRAALRERARLTLRHVATELPHVHGFFYHFLDGRTGERAWRCELSSIDTAILLCGVLACGEYFDDAELARWARQIYERVEWPWMLNGGACLAMGWHPEKGFLASRWDHYCELMMLVLLAVGSPTHPLPVSACEAWARPVRALEGERFIWSPAPLFVHQFSHAWFDFRGRRDRHADYFENSAAATRAHVRFCVGLRDRFPQFGEDLWGITSSDSARGYVAWGGPPASGPLDGTVVPCAAAGSLPFLPAACLRTLRFMRERFGDRIWKRYGFVDAFNPHTGWVNPDVIGIDLGITLLMAENARTGLVWRTFMEVAEMRRAMERVGFTPV